jgi:hypothetical protein
LEYNTKVGLDFEWQSLDGCLMKAPLGGEATGANPTDRGYDYEDVRAMISLALARPHQEPGRKAVGLRSGVAFLHLACACIVWRNCPVSDRL